MTAVFINAILLIIAFVLGYAMQPRISRKLSYRKRGKATKQRAAAKRATQVAPATQTEINTRNKKVVDQYINGGTSIN